MKNHRTELPGMLDLGSNYLEVHFVQQPFLSYRKGSHVPEPILPGIANSNKDIHGAVRSIQIFTTKNIFRIGPERRRQAGMPIGAEN
ncbi:hypothetical protein G4B88_010198 [Cannabis sativa]|uniref:Uncharacterized protein n=1 Tax=Cannabis sativa TaxID=3483 RepID=A0A7J6I5Z8_CANSA|nr:hypothetical protein G4B88_010198 [Cannabis sativa]